MAQLIKREEAWWCDPAIQTRTWVSILTSGKQPARTAAPVPVNTEASGSSCPPTPLSGASGHCPPTEEDTSTGSRCTNYSRREWRRGAPASIQKNERIVLKPWNLKAKNCFCCLRDDHVRRFLCFYLWPAKQAFFGLRLLRKCSCFHFKQFPFCIS